MYVSAKCFGHVLRVASGDGDADGRCCTQCIASNECAVQGVCWHAAPVRQEDDRYDRVLHGPPRPEAGRANAGHRRRSRIWVHSAASHVGCTSCFVRHPGRRCQPVRRVPGRIDAEYSNYGSPGLRSVRVRLGIRRGRCARCATHVFVRSWGRHAECCFDYRSESGPTEVGVEGRRWTGEKIRREESSGREQGWCATTSSPRSRLETASTSWKRGRSETPAKVAGGGGGAGEYAG